MMDHEAGIYLVEKRKMLQSGGSRESVLSGLGPTSSWLAVRPHELRDEGGKILLTHWNNSGISNVSFFFCDPAFTWKFY